MADLTQDAAIKRSTITHVGHVAVDNRKHGPTTNTASKKNTARDDRSMRDGVEETGQLLMHNGQNTSSIGFRMHREPYAAPLKL